jgi:hypothetical protein
MPGSSALEMATAFDEEIQSEGDAVTVWNPSRTITAGNPVENPVTLAGTFQAMFQEPEAVADEAMALGVDPDDLALVFFLSTEVAALRERAWVKDADGDAWLMESKPKAQRLEGTVIGVNVRCRRMPQKPPGMS